MSPSRGQRMLALFAICAATATVGVLGNGSPAGAVSPPGVHIYFPDMLVTPDSPGKAESIQLANLGETPVVFEDMVVSIDTAGADGLVATSLEYPTGCPRTGTVIRCAFGHFELPGQNAGWPLVSVAVKPLPGATVGQHAALTVTVSSNNVDPVVKSTAVTIAEGVDLTAGPDLTQSSAPGSRLSLASTVRNSGKAPVNTAVLVAFYSDAVTPTTRFSNCEYGPGTVICTFTGPLAPGKEYVPAQFPFTVRRDTPAPRTFSSQYTWATEADAELWRTEYDFGPLKLGDGPPVALVERPSRARADAAQTDINSGDNYTLVTVNVTGTNHADRAAVGTTIRGGVGATVSAKVGITNLGPARVGLIDGAATEALITVPAGTTAVSVPTRDCVPARDGKPDYSRPTPTGAPQYLCTTYSNVLNVGETYTWTIGLRIDATGPTSGTIAVGDRAEGDPNKANDTASIFVNPASTAGTGGSGGGSGGMLPITGGNVALLAGAGSLLIALGGLGFVVGRRRRTRFEAR